MNLINEQVEHESFGTGRIVKSDDSYIEIEFSTGNKKFVFPDAFAKHLKLADKNIENEVVKLLKVKKQELLEEEEKLNEERDLLLRERQIKREQERISKNHKSHDSLQAVFWCEPDELDEVFDDWQVSTGLIKSGAKEGEPNKLSRLNAQSVCLITTREPEMEEKDRRIEGLYMVRENFLGKLSEDGYIPAHSEYRLQLSDEESKKMMFWNYYVNNRYPDKMTWNTGRYRYFENIMVAQILRDIISLKKNPEEKHFVENFFEFFCKMNLIDMENLPKPNGTLMKD